MLTQIHTWCQFGQNKFIGLELRSATDIYRFFENHFFESRVFQNINTKNLKNKLLYVYYTFSVLWYLCEQVKTNFDVHRVATKQMTTGCTLTWTMYGGWPTACPSRGLSRSALSSWCRK